MSDEQQANQDSLVLSGNRALVARSSMLVKRGLELATCIPNLANTKTDDSSIETLKKKAEQGDANAQFRLGWCYDTGQGVAKDEQEAVKWYRKAAEQCHVGAQVNLGISYYFGKGVPQDYAEP